MNKLSFWHRLAFIANLCWLATWVLKYYVFLPRGDVQSTIIITGLLTANVVNFLVNLITGVMWLNKRLKGKVPRWLLLVNFIFFIAQLYIYIR